MLRSDSWVRRASAMIADKNMSDPTTTQSKICNDKTFCRKDAEGNGCRPCNICQLETSAIHKTDRLNPPEPKRTVAHSRSGRGIYNKAGVVVAGDRGWKPNTKIVTSTVAIASRLASPIREGLVFRIQEIPFEKQSTMAGTTVNSANAFVQNRSAPSGQ